MLAVTPVERFMDSIDDEAEKAYADNSSSKPELAPAFHVAEEQAKAPARIHVTGFLFLFTTTGVHCAKAPELFQEQTSQHRGISSKRKKQSEAVYSGLVGAFEVTLCVQRKGKNVGDIHLEIKDNVRNELPKLRAILSCKGRENSRAIKGNGKRGSTVFAGISMGEYTLRITEDEIERVSLIIKLASK